MTDCDPERYTELTKSFIRFVVAIPILWSFAMMRTGYSRATISNVMYEWSYQYRPWFVPVVVGLTAVLFAHWFVGDSIRL